jgi:polygalacturonase
LGDDSSRAEVSAEPYVSTQGGSGYAKDITFQNIVMDGVMNPIIVDQGYCDKAKPRRAQAGSAVEVSNVVFKDIRGTSVTKEAIKLDCSNNVPCHDITLQNIDLRMEGGKGATESVCEVEESWDRSSTALHFQELEMDGKLKSRVPCVNGTVCMKE